MNKIACGVVFSGIAVAGVAWGQQAMKPTLETWPGAVRQYVVTGGGAGQPTLAGPGGAMSFRPDGGSALTTDVGHVAGRLAVVLDGESFEAPPVTFPSNAFSVALWLRPLGMGTKTGNAGSVNGMIASSGSGYNDGWRLALYDWGTRQPTFELGQEKGAVSVRAGSGLSAGFWNHLAATWDGAVMRIYINGMPAGEKPFAGAMVSPKGALKLGFSGYGVGSLRMAADELVVFDRALSPREAVALSLLGVADRPAAEGMASALAAAQHAASKQAAAATCAAVFESPAAPAHLRGQAAEMLMRACRQGGGGELPSRVLAKLPECVELSAGEQRQFGLALGASFAREGNIDAAVRVFEQVLTADDASPVAAAEARQRYAQALRQAGRWDAARAQYAALAADTRLPAYVQGLAALALAQTWRQEGQWSEAVKAYAAAVAMTNQLAHLKIEAAESATECGRLADGKPARDPESHRERLRPLPLPAVEYVVSAGGSDANPGTLARPFATLERARDAVRTHKVNGVLPAGGATVWLRGGRYAVTNTFALAEADSGSFGAPVVYRAWQAERPVLDGGFRVRGLRKVSDPAVLARLPSEARGQVRVADVKAQGFEALRAQKGYGYGLGNKTVCELYQDGAPLQLARWPNAGTVKIEAVVDPTNSVFVSQAERLARWTGASDMLANGYWYHLWAGCTVPVAVTDPAAGELTLKEKPGGYGIRAGNPFYVLNLLEELDQPGEWYLDRANGLLYVWPSKHLWFSELVLSRWDKPVIAAKQVQEIVFQGLTVEYGQQHGLSLDECVNAAVIGCVVRRMGGTALSALQCANLKIYGNVLHTLGHTGMHVSGGSRKSLASGQIVIENNDVGDVGRLSRTYNPALLLEGCGARVAHNHFHHAPSSAMRIEGNDHIIEYNQVDHVVQESDDQGGIDMWGNPSYRGVVIRFNRWQDIGGGEIPCGQAGIRFDDAISGLVVYGNWFERASNGHFGGVQIHGGHQNILDNNVFVGCRYGVSFSPWGQKRWEEYLGREQVKRLMNVEVNVSAPPYRTRYPGLSSLAHGVDVNSLWRNVFVGCEEVTFRAPKGTDLWDNQVFAEVPELAAVSARTPFRPLPLDEIGLYDDPVRARD